MSDRNQIIPGASNEGKPPSPPRLVYSCRCGWLDRGHLDAKSYHPNEGAQSLWQQLTNESGTRSKKFPDGFKVAFQERQKIHGTVAGSYWVKLGLPLDQKKSVAQAIFKEISVGFEAMQASWPYSWGTDSGFSAEDLVSDLLGLYKTIEPNLDIEKICRVVTWQASLAVWDMYGPVGQHKNREFTPLVFPCTECGNTSGKNKAGIHRNGPYQVAVGSDGKIVVRAGDSLSKYSAAMYHGDWRRVHEFGRLKPTGLEGINAVNVIRAGETIYHIPTYELAKHPWLRSQEIGQPIPQRVQLPAELRQIPEIKKGGTQFRDWNKDDELSREEQMEARLPGRWK